MSNGSNWGFVSAYVCTWPRLLIRLFSHHGYMLSGLQKSRQHGLAISWMLSSVTPQFSKSQKRCGHTRPGSCEERQYSDYSICVSVQTSMRKTHHQILALSKPTSICLLGIILTVRDFQKLELISTQAAHPYRLLREYQNWSWLMLIWTRQHLLIL
jgi:hypothetical protein